MSDDTKPLNEASALLFRQASERHNAEINALADIAFRVDSMDPQTWTLRLDTMNYVRKAPTPEQTLDG